MNVFEHSDYKSFLKAMIEQNQGVTGYKTRLAKAAGCQKAFLSQVLHTHVHLTTDHGANLGEFWGLSEAEADYFCDLISYEKAATRSLKAQIKRRLTQNKDLQKKVRSRFPKAKTLNENTLAIYYSSWIYPALHVLCSIPELRTSESISRRLSVPRDFAHRALGQLREIGLVDCNKQGEWIPSERNLFVPNDSLFAVTNHTNWRQRAIADLQLGRKESIHYTGIHALHREDIEKIKSLFRDSIAQARKIVEPSAEEELICVTCDVFVV